MLAGTTITSGNGKVNVCYSMELFLLHIYILLLLLLTHVWQEHYRYYMLIYFFFEYWAGALPNHIRGRRMQSFTRGLLHVNMLYKGSVHHTPNPLEMFFRLTS